jgi:chromosome segregation ATPase
MRDVTDKVAGELRSVEQKRGRGRPRKADAMTNAERQAAYRARRKAGVLSGRTVAKEVPREAETLRAYAYSLVDRMHELQAITYEATRRAELAEAALENLNAELAEAQKRYQDLTDGYHRKCEELNQVIAAAALTREQRRNTVTSNDKSVTTAQWLALVGMACKGKTERQKDAVGHSEACRVVARLLRGRDFDRLRDAIYCP